MNTWLMLRAAGIGSYLMLFATVAWGLVGTTSVVGKKVSKATAVAVHQFLSTVAFVLLGVHLAGLLLDQFVPFGPLDLVVPLRASFKPWATALGILSMYTVVVVLVSSWARKGLGTKWWRRLHLLAVPAFGMSMVHGAFAGTDTVRPWMWITYLATGGIVVFLMLVRAMTVGMRARSARPAAAAASAAGGAGTATTTDPDPERAARIAAARAKSAAMRAAKAGGASTPPTEVPVAPAAAPLRPELAAVPVAAASPADAGQTVRVELVIHVAQDGTMLVGGAPLGPAEHAFVRAVAVPAGGDMSGGSTSGARVRNGNGNGNGSHGPREADGD